MDSFPSLLSFLPPFLLPFFHFLETGYCYVVQAGLELAVQVQASLTPVALPPLESWDYRHAPSLLA